MKSGAVGLDQLMIDIEDNDNSGYFPIQVFETQSELRTAAMITIPTLPGKDGPFDVVGWCSDDGGTLCEVTSVVVGDSGSGQALMIYGGDHGVRFSVGGTKCEFERTVVTDMRGACAGAVGRSGGSDCGRRPRKRGN